MRKVVGSNKTQLITQFLGESVFVTLIAMILSLVMLEFSIPEMDELLGKHLEINFFDNPLLLLGMIGITVIIGILSGLYLAFILSAFMPVTVLRGDFHKGGIGPSIRKVLVLFQFAITISLIITVLVIYDQINYLKSLDLGCNRDQVITVFSPNNARDLFKEKLSILPGVIAFEVNQKKSEIAIRRVLGSGELKIVFFLAKNFLKWVLIANLIAWPLSYFAIGLWLEGFVYRVSLTPLPFFLSGFTAICIALISMSFQSIKAARTNPADSLRNE